MSEAGNQLVAGEGIDHPCVWVGEELSGRPDWIRSLSKADFGELERAAQESEARGIATEEMTRDDFELPSLAGRFADVQRDLEMGSGATMIRGFPVGEYPPDFAARIFMGICTHVGTPISQSAAGERLFSVRDEGFADGDQRARGPNTRKRLSFHTDRCDVIGFLCVKQAKVGGENEVVSSAALYNEILSRRPDLLNVLMERYRYHRHNVDTANPLPFCEQPIFSIYRGHFASNLLRVLIERAYAADKAPDMNPIQREALDYLESVASEPGMYLRFRQEPGDILFLNNWVTYHRRTEFTDHAELEERRHLYRAWLSVPNSRPLHPDFAGNYGNTEAGAIRGGMRAGN